MENLHIETVEMHTGGEPLRIVKSGLPVLKGVTILDKRRYLKDNVDYLRKLLMFEPRGHYDMYGVYLVEPDAPGAVIGCIFIHNEGYSTMCGHAVIALGRYLVDHGIVQKPVSPETKLVLQCPCGPVEAFVEYNDGRTGNVRFNSVPAFVFQTDIKVSVPVYGDVMVDISYGGAFYALVSAERLGLDVKNSPKDQLVKAASAVTETLKGILKLNHPSSPDLAFLYGTILTDGKDSYSEQETANMCVFADKEVDRCPTGSGVTARIAQHFHRGLIKLNQKRVFVGPAGSKFTAQAISQVEFGSHQAVIVEVSGKAHYTGTSVFTIEADDEIGKGFLLK